MSDFPAGRFHKPVIGTFSLEALGLPANAFVQGVPSTGAWPAANLALYVPFALAAPYLVRQVWWINGTTAAGNVDCGIYSVGGTLLASAGSTAQSGTSVVQAVNITDIWLPPGSYYMALAASSTSTTFFRIAPAAAIAQLFGLVEQASAFALPATATFATTTRALVPLFGIAASAVI